MRGEIPKWHDPNAKDNPPFLDALGRPVISPFEKGGATATFKQSSSRSTNTPKPPPVTSSSMR
jgi:hypothetical protein